jgi:hypothetical protein
LASQSVRYKYSFTYDGLQEGPLSIDHVDINPSDPDENGVYPLYMVKLDITLPAQFTLSESKRITHVNIWRAERMGDEEVSLYRLVVKLPLTKNVFSKSNDSYVVPYNDFGIAGESFEVASGYPETIKTPTVSRTCSCMYNGSLFAGNVSIDDPDIIENTGNVIVKSEPFQPSIFDYTRQYASLQFTPIVMCENGGRIYVFGENEYSIINPDSMSIEGTNKTMGCKHKHHLIANDFGVYIYYNNNIYNIDGFSITPIGDQIKVSQHADIPTLDTVTNPIISYSNSKQCLIVVASFSGKVILYTYNVIAKTWVTYDITSITGALTCYTVDGEPYVCFIPSVKSPYEIEPPQTSAALFQGPNKQPMSIRWILDLGGEASDVFVYNIVAWVNKSTITILPAIDGSYTWSDTKTYSGNTQIDIDSSNDFDTVDITIRKKVPR